MQTMNRGSGTYELLRESVEQLTRGRGDPTRGRYQRVVIHVRMFLERVDVRGPLGMEAASALQAQRDVMREDSFGRCFGPAELVACLPLYLDDGWLAVQRPERVAQLRVVAAVARKSRACGVPAEVVDALLARVREVRTTEN